MTFSAAAMVTISATGGWRRCCERRILIGGSLFADWEPESDLSGIDAAMATWVSGDLAATVDALGGVEDDDECDWLFGGWGHDSFVLGNGDYWS